MSEGLAALFNQGICIDQVMMNTMDVTKLDLTEILAPATIMVVSVTASTTQGFVFNYNVI